MDIRRLSPEEWVASVAPLHGYAFSPSPMSSAGVARYESQLPYLQEGTALAAVADGTTLACAAAIPMQQNVRGVVHPMAGIAGVVSHPMTRRQGHVRTLLWQLLAEYRDEGYPVSALYPFRPSFYERFGFVGLPGPRTVSFSPTDLAFLRAADLPGEVSWQRIGEGYDDYRAFTLKMVRIRHGFSVFPQQRAIRSRDADDRWLVTARVDGEAAAAITYRIEEHGGDLVADELMTTGPLGRALLLRFFAGHVDQVARVVLSTPADELPELWGTDLAVHAELRTAFPTAPAPMARVLSLDALAGLPVGPGRAAVEVVDDPLVGGRYVLDGTGGQLNVDRGSEPSATVTAAGLSGLIYGVLDPDELAARGMGRVPPATADQLRSLFPRRIPQLFSNF